MINRRTALSTLATLTLAPALIAPAAAQTYPDKPIKLIVPFPAGGPTDFMARLISQYLSMHLGQVIVENRQHVGPPGTGRFVARKRFGQA